MPIPDKTKHREDAKVVIGRLRQKNPDLLSGYSEEQLIVIVSSHLSIYGKSEIQRLSDTLYHLKHTDKEIVDQYVYEHDLKHILNLDEAAKAHKANLEEKNRLAEIAEKLRKKEKGMKETYDVLKMQKEQIKKVREGIPGDIVDVIDTDPEFAEKFFKEMNERGYKVILPEGGEESDSMTLTEDETMITSFDIKKISDEDVDFIRENYPDCVRDSYDDAIRNIPEIGLFLKRKGYDLENLDWSRSLLEKERSNKDMIDTSYSEDKILSHEGGENVVKAIKRMYGDDIIDKDGKITNTGMIERMISDAGIDPSTVRYSIEDRLAPRKDSDTIVPKPPAWPEKSKGSGLDKIPPATVPKPAKPKEFPPVQVPEPKKKRKK